jgi:pilus assembly protein CpaB
MLRGKAPLMIALVLGLLAGVVAYSALKKTQHDMRVGWNPVPVTVAAVDIPEGTVVSVDMIAQRSVPEQFVTASVVKPDSSSYIVNQKVLVPLQAGDPLMWSQFETTRASEHLSAKVVRQMRAVTIEAPKVAAVGGWVRPNDHVDVVGTFRDPNTNEQIAVTLLQDVIVLATGKITGTTNVNLIPESQREYSNISLLVMPTEVEVLQLAQELGQLGLSLRNDGDIDALPSREHTTIRTLLSGGGRERSEEVRHHIIEMIRGNTRGAQELHP